MTAEAEPEPMMAIGEVARLWRVSTRTIRRWSEQGLLNPIRTPGGQRRFRAAEVEALLAAGLAAGDS